MPKLLPSRIRVPKFGELSSKTPQAWNGFTHLELTNATMVANAQGGAHRRNVMFREYPRVAVRAGWSG